MSIKITTLTIPATTYTHVWPAQAKEAGLKDFEHTSEIETITIVNSIAACCQVISFVADERIVILSIGSGHGTSVAMHIQSADSPIKQVFNLETMYGDEYDGAQQAAIADHVASVLLCPAIYEKNKNLMLLAVIELLK